MVFFVVETDARARLDCLSFREMRLRSSSLRESWFLDYSFLPDFVFLLSLDCSQEEIWITVRARERTSTSTVLSDQKVVPRLELPLIDWIVPTHWQSWVVRWNRHTVIILLIFHSLTHCTVQIHLRVPHTGYIWHLQLSRIFPCLDPSS